MPKNNYNVAKTATKVGYSQSYAYHDIHRNLVKSCKTKEYFNEKTVKRDIKKAKKLCLKKEDLTNYLRATELESKILGLQVDKSINTNINTDKKIELDNYYDQFIKPQ